MTLVTIILIALSGLVGLAVGSFLNEVAYRVPAKMPLFGESRCQRCDAVIGARDNVPVLGRVVRHGKCANCKASTSKRYPLVELLTGAASALITGYFLLASDAAPWSSSGWALAMVTLAYLYFAAISIVLTLIDLETHRLPNVIVLPSYVVSIVLLGAAALIVADGAAILRAVVGMMALYAFYFTLRLLRPDGMGGGDVKLAGVVGFYLGFIGWGALAVGAFFAFVYGGLFGVALLALSRAGRTTAIPFGPWMILGAWTGVFAGEAIGRGYLSIHPGS